MQPRPHMLPAPGPMDIHHAAVSRLLEQLLSVQPEEYDQVMDEATRLLEETRRTASVIY